MKTIWGRSFGSSLLTAALFLTQHLHALPRSPLPPVPEERPIYHESFDDAYFLGETNSDLLIPGFGILDESWSGYALARPGETVVPFIIPALDSAGHTNIASDTGGTLRFWIMPYWASQSQPNGTGPGTNATLLELDAAGGGQMAFAWSLQTSADGNTLNLIAQTVNGIEAAIQSQITWQAGQYHCLVLDFSPQGTALFLDGMPLAQGAGLPSIPCSVAQLAIGSTYSGANPAGADIEEFYSFDFFLTESDAAAYSQFTSAEAALGPISAQEEAALLAGSAGPQNETIHTPGNVYDPGYQTNCSTGGQPFITNILATIQTNGLKTVTFEIYGTNGVFYDIFATPNLLNIVSNNQWT
jgi:hypothetical protein